MAGVGLSPAALRAQLAALRGHFSSEESPVVAFHGDHAWQGGDDLQADNAVWSVLVSRSPLQIREALAGHTADSRPLVVLTPLTPADLGADVMARFTRRRLMELDTWEPVLRAFGASKLDARLAPQRWMADALLSAMPGDGYPQVPSGTLDAATAWRHVLRAELGVDADAVDLASLLEWSLDAAVVARWAALPDVPRRALHDWVADQAGPVARMAAASMLAGRAGDAVALGIVCGALHGPENSSATAREGMIRLERFTGGLSVSDANAKTWAEAASLAVSRLVRDGDRRAGDVLARADALLTELGANEAAQQSRWSPMGYAQRLDAYGTAILHALESSEPAEALAAAADALRRVLDHERCRLEPERGARVQHAMRLVRYVLLRSDDEPTSSFSDAVRAYEREHALADIARTWLASSEPSPVLAGSLSLLSTKVVETRETLTRDFARLLKGWFEAPGSMPGVVPVENTLGQVVAPLAGLAPVLVLVVDGMNLAVADALVASIQARGWVSVLPEGAEDGLVALGALPSITEVCRTSLLCGTLRTGVAQDERAGFAGHGVLLARSRPNKAPRLFHKADLGAGPALSSEVADAMADSEQRVVGAIVNAVDDHLLKEDMVRPQWSLEYVPILGALVDAARSAGRMIVLTSDHGHLLDLGLTERTQSEPADRYREPSGNVGSGEVLVRGPRVVSATGSVIAAASELVRYGRRKNGYHGGASPQEVVVPLHILCLDQGVPEGYRERRRARPAWWDLDTRVEETAVPVGSKSTRKGLPLFDDSARRISVVPPGEPSWLNDVIASDPFEVQRERAVRAGLPEARLRALLSALAGRGGRMTTAALAERLAVPVGRVSPIVAAAGQLLNFDGYQSIFVDGEDVVLDEAVLTAQFLNQP